MPELSGDCPLCAECPLPGAACALFTAPVEAMSDEVFAEGRNHTASSAPAATTAVASGLR
ncbi:hypothetical protein DVA86_15460 [Streptomyces armeniacus]|uniref:Uncharacterized protein n=1 Tax=Streptomyces armeniacus TaxID=83291 RepID=A0A345XQD3_9ACTN|nr:hypothetical protein DVA86_15460 [Streptomyces armeniacus]